MSACINAAEKSYLSNNLYHANRRIFAVKGIVRSMRCVLDADPEPVTRSELNRWLEQLEVALDG